MREWEVKGREIIAEFKRKEYSRCRKCNQKLRKVKYNKGHRVEGVWVFGMVEKTKERKIVLVQVEDRKKPTLEALLLKYVHPESTVHSDCWRSYQKLSLLFSEHLTKLNSLYFSDPLTKINTNTIEGNWSGVKKQVQYPHRTKKNIDYYLIRFIFKRNYKFRNFNI